MFLYQINGGLLFHCAEHGEFSDGLEQDSFN